MKAAVIKIEWHPGLSVFASELFLNAVGGEFGWLGGTDHSGKLRCILPYTVVRKAIFRMVRFRVETIPLDENLDIQDEKAFLNSSIKFFRSIGADMVIPASTNTIFRTYPDGADAAPYGSYVIDLAQPEDIIWKSINRKLRQNINTARKNGVTIRDGIQHLDAAHALISDTFKRSRLPFMGIEAFKSYVHGLGDHCKVMLAEYNGVPQSYAIFAFSEYCAYAVYAGNLTHQYPGANKLLYWEAIRMFKQLGVKRYDFVGARIDPKKGSKEESINLLKKRYGAKLKKGYIWKYSLHTLKYRLYCIAARLRSGGDIVDVERHKLKNSPIQ